MSDERFAQLEQRLAVLETLVRQLAAQRDLVLPPEAITQPRTVGPRMPAPPRPPLSGPSLEPADVPLRTAPPPGRPAPLFTEEWLGQKGLLAVGVIFLVLAAGYLLKLSFDRDWISPAARCVGGALAGTVVAALGWRLHNKGTRTYGAALIGAGAAIMYLAVWAAARRYEFLPPQPAIVSLALIAIGLAAVAYALNVQALGAAAAVGAFLAPIVIGREAGNANLLLAYLASVAAGLGTVSAIKRWRITMFIVALSYFGFAASSMLDYASPAVVYAYGIIGGAAGLYVGLREGWFETRFLAFAGGWSILWVANRNSDQHWVTLVGGIILTLPVWWRAITEARVWPDHPEGKLAAPGDSFYFYFSPLLLATALYTVAPHTFDDHHGLVAALIGVPYLLAGLTGWRRPFAIVGAIALAAAAPMEWQPQQASWVLLALAVFWAGMHQLLRRDDALWYSLGTYLFSLGTLMVAVDTRPGSAPAFVDAWALTLWAEIGFTVFAARRWKDRPQLVGLLWGLAGLLLLLGGTGELWRHFGEQGGSQLAGGLAVSAWWILFAGGCFFAGFRLALKPLRTAGFLVAGCALAKVLLVDLSTLDAFYRIGSALILGLVCLAVAYVYHRSRNTLAAK